MGSVRQLGPGRPRKRSTWTLGDRSKRDTVSSHGRRYSPRKVWRPDAKSRTSPRRSAGVAFASHARVRRRGGPALGHWARSPTRLSDDMLLFSVSINHLLTIRFSSKDRSSKEVLCKTKRRTGGLDEKSGKRTRQVKDSTSLHRAAGPSVGPGQDRKSRVYGNRDRSSDGTIWRLRHC